MSEATVDNGRRNWLITSCAVGGAGAAAVAVPFVSTFQPSERAKAAGAAVEVDVSGIQPGEKLVVEWRGKPVWILHRTPDMLAALARHEARLADAGSAVPQQPGYAANRSRAAREPFLVVIGICTHLGCSPTEKLASGADSGLGDDWPGGFLCPCHGSLFDLAGRVFRNQPAPTNLEVPPYQSLSDTRVLIGDDGRGEG